MKYVSLRRLGLIRLRGATIELRVVISVLLLLFRFLVSYSTCCETNNMKSDFSV
jgi:hypothetical protein